MALISDPRFILLPAFHFEPDGTFVSGGLKDRPNPKDLFSLEISQNTIQLPALPKRESAEFTRISIKGEPAPMELLSSTEDGFFNNKFCEALSTLGGKN